MIATGRSSPARTQRTGQLALAVAVAVVGFLLATQIRESRDLQARLASEREADLAQLFSDLSARSDRLQEEIAELRLRLAEAASSSKREAVLLDSARQELDSMRVLLGIVAVAGEGIEVTIADPEGQVGPDLLVDAIQELRDAGAEAIEVGGRRVVASSAFTGSPGEVRVEGAAVGAPIRILAIGARDTLAQALRIAGGVQDTVEARRGATIRIVPRTRLLISSLHPLPRFSYATRS